MNRTCEHNRAIGFCDECEREQRDAERQAPKRTSTPEGRNTKLMRLRTRIVGQNHIISQLGRRVVELGPLADEWGTMSKSHREEVAEIAPELAAALDRLVRVYPEAKG